MRRWISNPLTCAEFSTVSHRTAAKRQQIAAAEVVR
jgi:hypothetical protein